MARPVRLYLDAARLGAMGPAAQEAARDFARLAGEGLSTLYCEQFLRTGLDSRHRRCLRGLANWSGLDGLRNSVRRLVHAPPDAPVLFASRSAALFAAAVQLLVGRCGNILTTDTLWPAYRQWLEAACRDAGNSLTVVPMRDAVGRERVSVRDVGRRLVAEFRRHGCDGLCVSALSHDGVRIPVRRFLAAVREIRPDSCCVIDGAQEFAHLPVDLSRTPCDLYIAGCHKWLGAYQPLGIGVLPNPKTATDIRAALSSPGVDDPLLRFLNGLDEESSPAVETVNLTPLVCCWGAVQDFFRRRSSPRELFRQQLRAVRDVAALARPQGWRPVQPVTGLGSGILVLESEDDPCRELSARQVEKWFFEVGVTLTAYGAGVIRLSIPPRPLRAGASMLLHAAFDSQRHQRLAERGAV